jgi:hypothetical protein
VHQTAHTIKLVRNQLECPAALLRVVFQEIEMALNDRDRSSEFVTCVVEELSLQPERFIEPVEHLVECRGELGHLVVARDLDPPA